MRPLPLGTLPVAAVAAAACGTLVHRHGFVVLAALASTAAVGLGWPWLTLRPVLAAPAFDADRGREGEPARYRVALTNRGPLPAAGLTLTGLGGRPVPLPRVGPFRTVDLPLAFVPPQRGAYPADAVHVTCGLPFGLWHPGRAVRVDRGLLAWPAAVAVGPPAELRGRRSLASAAAAATRSEFHLGRVVTAHLLGWQSADVLRMRRAAVPPGTVLDVDCAPFDPARYPADDWVNDLSAMRPTAGAIAEPRLSRLARQWTTGLPRGWPQVAAVVGGLRERCRLDPAYRPADADDRLAEFLFGSRRGPDHLIGRKGSSTQLVTNTVHQLDQSPGNLPYLFYDDLLHKREYRQYVRLAVPYVVGDSYQGKYRIVGTTLDLFGYGGDGQRLLDDEVMGYRLDAAGEDQRYAVAETSSRTASRP